MEDVCGWEFITICELCGHSPAVRIKHYRKPRGVKRLAEVMGK